MTDVTQRFPPQPVPFAKAQNLKPGIAEIVQQSAGMLATLEGHSQGAALIGGASNPVPLNPSGDRGHDHSGGEFGRPLFRTVATMTFDDGRTFNSSAMEPGYRAPGAIYVPDAADGLTNASRRIARHIWVPPCDPVEGAYVSLGVAVALYGSGLTHLDVSSVPIVGDVATLRVWRAVAGAFVVAELDVTSPAVAGQKYVASSGVSTRLQMRPGAWNEIVFELELARTTGGSTRGMDAWLLEAELGVYES